MKTSKIGVLFLVAVLALTGIGMSYAGYIDVITITGTVTTGTVDMELDSVFGTWFWKEKSDAAGNQLHNKYIHRGIATEDDVGGTSDPGDDLAAFADLWYDNPHFELYSYATAFEDPDNEDTIKVKFENVYPMSPQTFEYKLAIKLHYVGKIPARIVPESIVISEITADPIEFDSYGPYDDPIEFPNPDENWIEYLLNHDNYYTTEEDNYINYWFVHDNGYGDPNYEDPVDECDQFHYCDYIWLIIEGEIPQHNAFQGLTGSMSMSFALLQFDEVDCEPETGTIIVEKQTVIPVGMEDPGKEFEFIGDAAGFLMDDEQIIVSGLAAGTYTSTELLDDPYWTLTSIVLDDSNSVGDILTQTATFHLEEGETVKAIFTNTYEDITNEKPVPIIPGDILIDVDPIDFGCAAHGCYKFESYLNHDFSAYPHMYTGSYDSDEGFWGTWCVELGIDRIPGYVYLIGSWLAETPSWPSEAGWLNDNELWSMINWIINHKEDYPTAEMNSYQYAIWNLTDDLRLDLMGTDQVVLDAISIANDARLHPDYYPENPGDVFAVLLWPVDENGDYMERQALIIEIDP